MAGRHSNEKGATFERGVCNRLSLWVSGLARDDVFWRAAMSGGRANLPSRRARGQRFTAHAGDISATHELGHLLLAHFIIECKHMRDFDVHSLVYSGRGTLRRIWEKACEESARHKRKPLLIFKQNNHPEMFGVDSRGVRYLSDGLAGDARLPITAHFPAIDLHLGLLREMLLEVDYARLRDPAPKRARLKRG